MLPIFIVLSKCTSHTGIKSIMVHYKSGDLKLKVEIVENDSVSYNPSVELARQESKREVELLEHLA